MAMRCIDVMEGLATPHGPDSAAVTEHLTHCPSCAEWARQGARLDRLWEATRPDEPAPETWTTVWAEVSQALDQARPLRLVPAAAPRPWRRWGIATFAVAQAAVILVAAWLVARPGPDRPQARTDLARKPAASVPGQVRATDPSPPTRTIGEPIKIDDGEVVLIRINAQGVPMVSRSRVNDDGSSAVDGLYDMHNYLESKSEESKSE
jgi:hypothetical protein